jgi:outer membrane protein assembly factor BamA
VVEQRILNYYEKNGHPFAEVFLDSIRLIDDRMEAMLSLRKNIQYRIDSIRVFGNARISKKFIQHYLGISNGSLYNKEKLDQVNKRILDLSYVRTLQQADLTMLGSGSVLNLYMAAKKNSQANFLIGFLPSSTNDGKLQITADVNLDLKNLLGAGENILVNWQQLQPKSPRLNLGYQKPYIFNSDFGIDALFNLFKKDSSFLQVNGSLGLQYLASVTQSGKVFMLWQNSYLLEGAVDTNEVKATKKLPPNIDVSAVSFGLEYELNKTDYRLNPRMGNELKFTTIIGIKKTRQNNQIISIKDPSFNYTSLYDSVKSKAYQLRFKLNAAHYFPLGKQGTFKTAIGAGAFFSPDIFRNELFQIGGYRLMRGFNEESIYATQYGVITAEYRYRLALNSFLFTFIDAGKVKNKYQDVNLDNTLLGAGLGMAFETKFGLLNISYAIGKRNDVPFNIREASKIHFGYVNYF